MVEAGGPATQAGIFFQNSIAALYLGRMLDLRQRPVSHRITRVRIEAPEEVDDIVVGFGDGTRRYIQARRTISASSNTWDDLWTRFSHQTERTGVNPEDRLLLVVGSVSTVATNIAACCERAGSAIDNSEYLHRLTQPQKRIVDSIRKSLSDRGYDISSVRHLLARTDVEIIVDTSIERDHAPIWMPESSVMPDRLLGLLRDIAGGASRTRGSFDAPALRAKLKDEHNIELAEPESWGSAHYRSVLLGRAILEVPGTSFAKPISDAFLWPRATRFDRTRRADFDDETPRSVIGVRSDEVDLSLFPGPSLSRVVVIAGPGFGKTALTLALAVRVMEGGRLPAIISIPELSRLDVNIVEYLMQHLNKAFEVAIDWIASADSGLLVLIFDGLDEVSSDRRAVVLERIKTFSVRHSTTPWMLTVRDAAALAAPTDALLVELEPLDNDDIERFVALYRPEDTNLPNRLTRRFETRPDLQRLVRIPLFLAIMLASITDPDKLPSNRTELLELYLELLFRPEQFKRSERDSVDPATLRPIAEAIAFYALEREEIGINARFLDSTIRRHVETGTPLQPTIERLVKCGVIRRTSPSRFEFPFPIVQEYLAACHITANHLEQVPERLSSVNKRPWAQALQFVLEAHPSPSHLVAELLAREEDAFSTNLRLLARCVANGMAVSQSEHEEIARRLATIWPGSSWRMCERIGDLISEAFCIPLIPEVRVHLSNRWLLHSGAGLIVARIADRDLTSAVLRELLAGDTEFLVNLWDMQEPVNTLGDEALNLYASVARDQAKSDAERNAMASLIHHLDGASVSEATRLSVALDEELPYSVRLSAFALGPAPIDERAEPLIEDALAIDDYRPLSSALEAIAKTADPASAIRSALLRTDITRKSKLDIVDFFPGVLPTAQRLPIIRSLARDPSLAEEFRWRLLVFAARYGEEPAMTELIDQFDELPTEIVNATIAILGFYRSQSLVESAVERLQGRVLAADERANVVSSAVVGMTSIYEMDFFRGGILKPAAPHPGLPVFRPLLDQWSALEDYAPLDALRMAEDLACMGSESALAQIPARITQVLEANDTDLQDMDHAHTVGSAIRIMRERQQMLDIPFLESVIARCSYNGASSAAEMIAAHGSREAFDSLLQIYEDTSDSHLRGIVLDSIETLASRLGLRVWKVGSHLEAAAN